MTTAEKFDPRLHDDAADDAVDVPADLGESESLDEENRLKDGAYQERIAAAVLGGIKRYLAANPPLARSKVASR